MDQNPPKIRLARFAGLTIFHTPILKTSKSTTGYAGLIKNHASPLKYINLFSKGYPSGKYGDQSWRQEENGMKGESLFNTIKDLLQ